MKNENQKSKISQVFIPDVETFPFVGGGAENFGVLDGSGFDLGTDVVKTFQIVKRVVFDGDLLDVVEVVGEGLLVEELINAGKSLSGGGGEFLERDEVHAIAEAAEQSVADAVVSDPNDLIFTHQDIAAAFDRLEFTIKLLLVRSGPRSAAITPELFKTGKNLPKIANTNEHLGLTLNKNLGKFEMSEPRTALVENNGPGHVHKIAFEHGTKNVDLVVRII